MARQIKGWDARVAEAQASKKYEPVEFPIGKKTYTVKYPTKSQVKRLQEHQLMGELDEMVLALLGPSAGKEIVKLSDEQPIGILDGLVRDVLREFGLSVEVGDDDEADEGKAEETSDETSDAA